jgi:hypothetical protein
MINLSPTPHNGNALLAMDTVVVTQHIAKPKANDSHHIQLTIMTLPPHQLKVPIPRGFAHPSMAFGRELGPQMTMLVQTPRVTGQPEERIPHIIKEDAQ